MKQRLPSANSIRQFSVILFSFFLLNNSAGAFNFLPSLSPCGLSLTSQSSPDSSAVNSNGRAAVIVSTGTAPYSYLWSPGGGTNSAISGLRTGTYNVTVSDNGGCSQSIAINVGHTYPIAITSVVEDTVKLCRPDTFKVHTEFSRHGTDTLGVAIYFPPPLQVAYIDTSIHHTTFNDTTFFFHPDTTDTNYNFSFTFNDCDLIPPNWIDSSGNNPSYALPMFFYDHTTHMHDTSALLVFNRDTIGTNPVILYTAFSSFLELGSNPFQSLGNIGDTIIRTITYRNVGTSDSGDFRGYFTFRDLVNCPNLSIFKIDVKAGIYLDTTITGSNLINQLIKITLSSPGSDTVFSYNSGRGVTASQISFVEYFKITGCLDSCLTTSISTCYFKWGCDSATICKTDSTIHAVISRNPQIAGLQVTRISPVAVNPNYNNAVWESYCPDSIVEWVFRITNYRPATAYQIHINVQRTLSSMHYPYVYLISDSTSGYYPYLTDTVYHQAIDSVASQRLTLSGTLPYCYAHLDTAIHPIEKFSGIIEKLDSGQYADLHLFTYRCCPDSSDNFLFNDPISFNNWGILVDAMDECKAPSHTARGVREIGGDLNLVQTFNPSVTYMLGGKSFSGCIDSSFCSHAHPEFFSIQNSVFSLAFSNADVLSNAYNADEDSIFLQDKIMLRFDLDAGLQLYNNDSNSVIDSSVTMTNGTYKWIPNSVHFSDSCKSSGKNFYTVIFDVDSLPLMAGDTNRNSLLNFRKFINGSFINFYMMACCCHDGNNDYTVSTYLNGDTNCTACWMPLARQGGSINVLCPGCQSPGTEVNSFKLIRSYDVGYNSYGYPDSSDRGRADTIAQIDSSYIRHHPLLKTNFSVQGDYVKGILDADFKDGNNGCGISYSRWKTCTGRSLDYLYLDQVIPFSDSTKFKLVVQSCKLTIHTDTFCATGHDTTVSLNIPTSDISFQGETFRYNLSLSKLDSAGLNPCYRFRPGDQFHVEALFHVCGNMNARSWDAAESQSTHKSDITCTMYLSDTILNSAPSCMAGDLGMTDSCSTIPSAGCGYKCGAFGNPHYFIETHTTSNGVLGGTNCKPTVTLTAISNFGGKAIDPFPFEYRPAPEPDSMKISVPYGYIVYDGSAVTHFYTYGDGPNCSTNPSIFEHISQLFSLNDTTNTCIGQTLNYNDSIFRLGTSYPWQIETIDTAFDYDTLSCSSEMRHCIGNNLIRGDESSRLDITLYLTTTCSTPDSTLLDGTLVEGFFTVPSCPSVHETLFTGYTFYPLLYKNAAFLSDTLIDSLAQQSFNNKVFWNLNLYDTSGFAAFNAFFYPSQNDPNFEIDSIISVSGCSLSHNSHGVYGINSVSGIAGHSHCSFKFYGHQKHCLANNTDSILVYYGWDCAGQIDSINHSLCNLDSIYLKFEQVTVGVAAELRSDTLKKCDTSTFTVNIKVNSLSPIYHLDIILPDTSTYAPIHTCMLQYYTFGFHDTVTFSGNQINLSSYDNTLFASDSDHLAGLSRGESIDLRFKFIPFCTYNDSLTPLIILKALAFCGDTITDSIQPKFWNHKTNNCGNLSMTTGSTVTTCGSGTCSGVASITATSGVHSSGILTWYNNSHTGSISGLCMGTYTVTLTDAYGCTADTSVTINGDSICCGTVANELIRHGDTLLAGPYTGFKNLNGNVIVTSSYDPVIFDKLDLSVAAGVSITVEADATLIIRDTSYLHACNEMWRGIIVNDGGTLIVQDSSKIEDAQYGIEAKNGANYVRLHKVTFNRNYVDFYVAPISGTNVIHTCIINNCRFICNATLKSGFSGQSPMPETFTNSGILVNNLALLNLTNGDNFFDHLNAGISSYNSTVTMDSGVFNNIQRWDTSASDLGAAISAKTYSHLTYTGYGNSTANFDNCLYGVYASYSDVNVTDAKMTNMHIGILARHDTYHYITLDSNNIGADYAGIDLQFNDYSQQTEASGNYIYSDNLPLFNGIEVWEARIGNPNSSIANNEVHLGPGYNIGLFISNARLYDIAKNNIYLSPTPHANAAGMSVCASAYDNAHCNNVQGVDSNLVNSGQIAVYTADCYSYFYKCNDIDSTYDGFYYYGTNYGRLESNNIKNHAIGLHVAPDGIGFMGPQDHKGNVWLTNPLSYAIKGAFDEDSLGAPQDQFKYFLYVPPSFIPNTWFIPKPGTDSTCGISNSYCNPPVPAPRRDTVLTATDILVAQDSIHSDAFDDQTIWIARRNLMEKLISWPPLVGQNDDVNTFYDAHLYDNIGAMSSVRVRMDTLYNISSSTTANINGSLSLIRRNSAVIAYNDSLLINDSTLTSGQIATLRSDDSLRMDSISISSVTLNTIYSTTQSSVASKGTAILSTNNGLSSSLIYEQNEITVNGIYLSTIAQGLPDSINSYQSDLYAIATQCPLRGGPAVYFARSLYSLINDSIIYDDDQKCASPDTCLVPHVPGLIRGQSSGICPSTNIRYSISPVTGATSYTWSLSDTSATISGASNLDSVLVTFHSNPNPDVLSVMASNACGQSVRRSLIIAPVLGTISSTTSNVACHGGSDGSAFVSASGGTLACTYHWNTSATTSSISSLSAATYSVTVTDANGCTSTSSSTVTQPSAALAATASVIAHVSCHGGNNGSASVTASGGTTAYTYVWSNGSTASSAILLTAGTYSVTVKDSHGCTATSSATLTQPPTTLTASCGGTHVTCHGGSDGAASVTASGGTLGYSYLWNNGAFTSSLTLKTAGIYSVTVTDSHSCSASCSFTITQPTALSGTCSVTNVSCNGGSTGSVSVSASGGNPSYTYHWNYKGNTTTSITGLTAADYSVTVTDAHGCTAVTTVSVTQPTVLSATAIATNVSCHSGSNGSVSASVTGGTSPYTYHWNTSATTSSISSLTAATYSVTVTDAHLCTTTASATLTQPSATLTATSGGTHVSCNGGNNGAASVTASGGTTAYTYLWSNSATTSSLISKTAGIYSVTVTDAHGCTATSSFTITQPTALSATCGGANVSCHGGSNGSASVTASGGTSAYTYHWSNSATTTSISSLASGIYSVTVTDAHACTSSSFYTVTQPSANLTDSASSNTPVCLDSTLTLSSTVSGGTSSYTYSWTGPNSFSSTVANPSISSATTSATGTYSLTVTDAHGCTATTTTSATVHNCPTVLSLNLMIEGYYVGSALMEAAMYNEGVSGATSSETDTITVELHNPSSPYATADSVKTILNYDGTATASFSVSRTNHYYWIAIKHRNAIQTWSHDTVYFTSSTSYDFTADSSKAYGDNMINVDTGIWALYNGDLNQDGSIDISDYPIWDYDQSHGFYGYYKTDMNGDGNVDLLDWPVLDDNISAGIYSQHP